MAMFSKLAPTTNNPGGFPVPNGNGAGGHDPRTVPKGTGGLGPKPPGNGNNNGGNNDPKRMAAFMPGQFGALASQMNYGFGSGMDKWRDYLHDNNSATPLPDFNYATFGVDKGGNGQNHNDNGHNGHNNHNGDNGHGDPSNPDTHGGDPNPGHDHSKVAMMGNPMAGAMAGTPSPLQMPGLLSGAGQMPQPGMPPQMPQGLLGGAQPPAMAQQPQQPMQAQGMAAQGMPGAQQQFGGLPPAILAMLRQRMMQGGQ